MIDGAGAEGKRAPGCGAPPFRGTLGQHRHGEEDPMPGTIVYGKTLVCDADTEIPSGALYLEGDTIREVGTWGELSARHPRARRVGDAEFLVVPGFVNAHSHGKGLTDFQRGDPGRHAGDLAAAPLPAGGGGPGHPLERAAPAGVRGDGHHAQPQPGPPGGLGGGVRGDPGGLRGGRAAGGAGPLPGRPQPLRLRGQRGLPALAAGGPGGLRPGGAGPLRRLRPGRVLPGDGGAAGGAARSGWPCCTAPPPPSG